MKKNIVLFLLSMNFVCLFAQQMPLDSSQLAQKPIFKNFEKAFEKPLEVYRLHISQKSLTELPEKITELKNLQELFCWGNELKELPSFINQLKFLTNISCGNNPLTTLPNEIGDLIHLKKIMCNEAKKFTTIPVTLKKLKKLKILAFAGCNIADLPKEIGEIENLEELSLQYNQIKNLPNEMGNLSKLKLLELHNNMLNNLPNSFSKLKLSTLKLNDNALKNIPKEIFEIETLKTLSLENTSIDVLDKQIKNLKNLVYLDIANNNLTELPKELAQIKSLTYIDCKGNKISDIDKNITNRKEIKLKAGGQRVENMNYNSMPISDVFDEIKEIVRKKEFQKAIDLTKIAQKRSEKQEGSKSENYTKALAMEALLYHLKGDEKAEEEMFVMMKNLQKQNKINKKIFIEYLGEVLKQHQNSKNLVKEEEILWLIKECSATKESFNITSYQLSVADLANFYHKKQNNIKKANQWYASADSLANVALNTKNSNFFYTYWLQKLAIFYEESNQQLKAYEVYDKSCVILLEEMNKPQKKDDTKITVSTPQGQYTKVLKMQIRAYYRDKNYEKAAERSELLVKEMAKIYQPEDANYMTHIQDLVMIYDKLLEPKKAIPYVIQLKNTQEKIYGKKNNLYQKYLNYLYFLYSEADMPNEAEPLYLEECENTLHSIQTQFPSLSEKEKNEFYEKYSSNFEFYTSFALNYYKEKPHLLAWLYDMKLATKALLLDASVRIRNRILQGNDEKLKQKFQTWQTQKENLGKIYQMSKTEISDKKINIKTLEQENNNLEKEISLASEKFVKMVEKRKLTWKDVQKKLKKDEAAIEIYRLEKWKERVSEGIFYVILIVKPDTKDYPEIVIIESGNIFENTLEDKFLKRYRNYIKNKVEDKKSYEAYWKPIAEKLKGIKKVLISPDGVYNQISLVSLFNAETGRYLNDEIGIELVSNTKDLIVYEDTKNIPPKIKEATLIGFPDYNNAPIIDKKKPEKKERNLNYSLPLKKEMLEKQRFIVDDNIAELPGTKTEVDNLEVIFKEKSIKTKKFIAKDASEELIKNMGETQILHIATHGFFLDDIESENDNIRSFAGVTKQKLVENPLLRSGLLLAGSKFAFMEQSTDKKNPQQEEDGVLTALEVTNLNLDNIDLVALSACETGLGEIKNGEGVYGLQRAFQTAGAKSVLMSLWTVSDDATQKLMTYFYQNWISKKMIKRKAFHEAQLKLRQEYPEPYYWAAFVLIGN